MRKLFLLLFLAGCSSPVELPGVYEYHSPKGKANCFVLKYNNKFRLITSRHITSDYYNENFDDIAVLDLNDIDKTKYLEPSSIRIPFCTLPKEKPRMKYPVSIVGYFNNKLIQIHGYACGHLRGENIDIIFTTASAKCGMSGSPVLDKDGKVLGIVTSIISPTSGYDGYARSKVTPIERALYRMK